MPEAADADRSVVARNGAGSGDSPADLPAILIDGLGFRWPRGQSWGLDLPRFELARGERLFLAGPSGSGKTSLLSLITGIVRPACGRLCVLGTPLDTLHGGARDRFRADHFGIVFQLFNLLPYLSVLDNVLLGCRFSPLRTAAAAARGGSPTAEAARLLGRLGLGEPSLQRRPATELSVGQQQRVAAARALIGSPPIVIADEPTSALDGERRQEFLALLLEEVTLAGSALLFVSHDRTLARDFDREVTLGDAAPA
jgi:putative ABC transport system ATP-binding protein